MTIVAAAAGMIVVALVVFIQPAPPTSAARVGETAPPVAAGTYLDQPLRAPSAAPGNATTSVPANLYAAANPQMSGSTTAPNAAPAEPNGVPAGAGAPTHAQGRGLYERGEAPAYTQAGAGGAMTSSSPAFQPATTTTGPASVRESTATDSRRAAFLRALSAPPVAGFTPVRSARAESMDGLGTAPAVASAALASGDARDADSGGGEPASLTRSEQFMQAAARRGTTSQSLSVDPSPGPYAVQAGTVIPAILMTEINSDLPGECLAQITRDVFDTRSQQTLLIPRGAKLLCTYDDQLATGQSRLLVAWTRILLPDGRSITLPGLPATDHAGARGVADQVDRHTRKTFGTAAVLSLISAGAQLAMPQRGSVFAPPNAGQVMAGALGQELNTVAVEMLRRDMRNQQTIRIRQGTEFNVFLNTDLTFPGPYPQRVGPGGGLARR